MNSIAHKKIFLSVSGLLVLVSMGASIAFGFTPGIEFAGGTLWQIRFAEETAQPALMEFFAADAATPGAIITRDEENGSFLTRTPELAEEDHARLTQALTESFGEFDELRFETIGAVIGGELLRRSITAFILVLLAISLYTAFAFRKVSRPVSSWKYGVVTLMTLFHDTLIPAGAFAVLGYVSFAEANVNFIVALLVIMGFSVHDTIVVMDRIRENVKHESRPQDTFDEVVNRSVNETIARSINTSLTLLFVLAALYLFGPAILREFVLVIGIGTIVGTYSSIFVASPLLTVLQKRER
jgi:preprotein translocase subunit SecF